MRNSFAYNFVYCVDITATNTESMYLSWATGCFILIKQVHLLVLCLLHTMKDVLKLSIRAGGTVVCAASSTKVIFESVRMIGSTIVVTGGANVIVSRCSILDCPVAIIAHGAGTNALVRNCTARGCAAFVVSTGGASTLVKDSTVEMSDSGAVAVDVRGPSTYLQATDSTMKGAGDATASTTDPDNLAALSYNSKGVRGRNGATIELVKYNITGFMTGVDVCGAGTVIEARECQMHENMRSAIRVCEGAAAELVGCSAGRGGSQALVVKDVGTSVRADRCGFGGTAGDALVAADGAGVRLKYSNIAHVVDGCAIAASGTSSRVKCVECVIDDNGGGGFKVSASASCMLSECKITQSHGTGVSVSGVGSQVDLSICQVEGHETFGLRVTDGATLNAQECVVMRCGNSGAAISGPQAHLHATECYFADHQQVAVDVSAGAAALLRDGQLWHSQPGYAVRVQGQGSRVELQSLEANACDGAVLALEGASAEARKCTLETGVRVRDTGTNLKLSECKVQSISLVKGDAVLVAESSEFNVKPQVVPGSNGPVPSTAPNIQLSEDNTWHVEPLQSSELSMYTTDPEWNGSPVPLESVDVRGEQGDPYGTVQLGDQVFDLSDVSYSNREMQAIRAAARADARNPRLQGLPEDDAIANAYAATAARIAAPSATQASAARAGVAAAAAGASHSRTATVRADGDGSAHGQHAATVAATEGSSLPNGATAAASSSSSRSRTFWMPNRSNHWPSMFSSGSTRRRQQPADSSPVHAPARVDESPTRTPVAAGAAVATSSHTATAYANNAALQNSSAPPGGAQFYADTTPAQAQQAADVLQVSANQHAQSAAQAPVAAVSQSQQHQRHFQRMPQLLTTNYDSGAQPSTEDSTSAASTLNAPVHGAFLPPADLADIHAGNFLGREPSRSSTQMTADAAQAETTLSPHVAVRGSARDREQRSTREHREQSAVGSAAGDSAAAAPGVGQHQRRGASSRRNQVQVVSARLGHEAALDLNPRHISSTLPLRARSTGGNASTGVLMQRASTYFERICEANTCLLHCFNSRRIMAVHMFARSFDSLFTHWVSRRSRSK